MLKELSLDHVFYFFIVISNRLDVVEWRERLGHMKGRSCWRGWSSVDARVVGGARMFVSSVWMITRQSHALSWLSCPSWVWVFICSRDISACVPLFPYPLSASTVATHLHQCPVFCCSAFSLFCCFASAGTSVE